VKKFFSTIWGAWKKFGHFMGDFIGRLVLMLFYITIVLPFGVGARLFSDRLDIRRRGEKPTWNKRGFKNGE